MTSEPFDLPAGLPAPDLLGPDWIMLAIVNIGVWGGVGFNMLVIFTALRAIPRELHESARMDGCSELQIAWRVKIPLVVPALILAWSPRTTIYRDAFMRNDIHTAAAASVVLAAASLLVSFGFLRLVQRRAFAQEDQ